MRDPLRHEPHEFTEVDVDGEDIVYVSFMAMEKICRGTSYANGPALVPASHTRVSDAVKTADLETGFRTVRNI